MGFKREKKTYRLIWGPETPDMDGLVVVAKTVPTGTMLLLAGLVDRVVESVAKDAATVNELLEGFARALVSWNLEDDDDVAVPATLDGLFDQDIVFVVAIVRAWITAQSGVSDDLGKGLPSGVTFPEGSLPMEALSTDLVSLITP